jgi:hypothetical protein
MLEKDLAHPIFLLRGVGVGASAGVHCYIASSSESSEHSPAPCHAIGSLSSSPQDVRHRTISLGVKASKTLCPVLQVLEVRLPRVVILMLFL